MLLGCKTLYGATLEAHSSPTCLCLFLCPDITHQWNTVKHQYYIGRKELRFRSGFVSFLGVLFSVLTSCTCYLKTDTYLFWLLEFLRLRKNLVSYQDGYRFVLIGESFRLRKHLRTGADLWHGTRTQLYNPVPPEQWSNIPVQHSILILNEPIISPSY